MRKFPRTFHALDAERPGLSIVGLVLVSLLLAAWLVWLFAARISVFEVTPLGRLEVDRALYPIASQVDGKVLEVPMTMGRRVVTGDLLVLLDARDFEIRLQEEEARRASIENELAAIRRQLDLARRTTRENRHAVELALEEKRVQLHRAKIEADLAELEAERMSALFDDGQVSQMEAERKRADADRLRQSVKSFEITVELEEARLRSSELEGETEHARLGRELAELEGEGQTVAVEIEKTRHEIEKHSVRAPRAGEVGEVADLRVSSTVREGEQLGTILASGEIRVVADFAAASALGRIGLGQTARVRLDGFPWTQFGMLAATVHRVASEPRAGRLRVELELGPESDARLPLTHGLTGTVEVEVERISPAGLLLRTLGKALRPAAAATDGELAAHSAGGGPAPR